jgi:hypothetical protein
VAPVAGVVAPVAGGSVPAPPVVEGTSVASGSAPSSSSSVQPDAIRAVAADTASKLRINERRM